jgi:hypothetical protein
MYRIAGLVFLLCLVAAGVPAGAQMGNPANGPTKIPDAQLDPAQNLQPSELESAFHKPLPEQYIWTKADAIPGRENVPSGRPDPAVNDLAPHYFRRLFAVNTVPAHATLYLAGPRKATIYLNGKQVGQYTLNLDFPMGIRVYECDVTSALHTGRNILAIEAVRGPDATNQSEDWISRQQSHGQVLAAMILPAALGIQAPRMMMSDAEWKAQVDAAPAGWQGVDFDDSTWPNVNDLGGIEGSIDLFQGNADAGMYAWPGYDGISPFLAHYTLTATKVTNVYAGMGAIQNPQALTGNAADGELTVTLPTEDISFHNAPQVMLDFGREVTGRLELQSDSDSPAEVTAQYGESEAEALTQPYLGIDPIHLPPHATAYGPKSAFRYAVVRFTGGRETRYSVIRLDGISYPVRYQGSFESSDAELNTMWTVGAYTAHLCMQDDIWDAPKRDRRRWMGDLDVSGRTIDDVFADRFLMEDTLNRLIGDAPVEQHVNGIPGYSAFYLTGEKDYYLHTGSMKQLESVHSRLVLLLEYMEKDLNQQNLFSDLSHAWPFVDWSPEMTGYGPQTRMATQFEYYAAFEDGAYLLHVLHDETKAKHMEERADTLKAAAQRYMRDAQGSFGNRWQPNAYAVLSGVTNQDQYAAIWHNSLSDVGHVQYNPYIITPYYNNYVISAMAKMGERQAALNWIRQYWGGMVQEGATSFWEGYDPSWYKGSGFHQSLQADGSSGLFVSLAHGWSSGVTPWLMEQVLGIQPTAGGFAKVNIRPDLIDLHWAKGTEPTPHGLLGVDIKTDEKGYVTTIDLPTEIEAQVSVPIAAATDRIFVNGKPVKISPAEGGKRAVIVLKQKGHYTIGAG